MSDPFYSDDERRAEINARGDAARRARARTINRLAPGDALESYPMRTAARPRRGLRELALRVLGIFRVK